MLIYKIFSNAPQTCKSLNKISLLIVKSIEKKKSRSGFIIAQISYKNENKIKLLDNLKDKKLFL